MITVLTNKGHPCFPVKHILEWPALYISHLLGECGQKMRFFLNFSFELVAWSCYISCQQVILRLPTGSRVPGARAGWIDHVMQSCHPLEGQCRHHLRGGWTEVSTNSTHATRVLGWSNAEPRVRQIWLWINCGNEQETKTGTKERDALGVHAAMHLAHHPPTRTEIGDPRCVRRSEGGGRGKREWIAQHKLVNLPVGMQKIPTNAL